MCRKLEKLWEQFLLLSQSIGHFNTSFPKREGIFVYVFMTSLSYMLDKTGMQVYNKTPACCHQQNWSVIMNILLAYINTLHHRVKNRVKMCLPYKLFQKKIKSDAIYSFNMQELITFYTIILLVNISAATSAQLLQRSYFSAATTAQLLQRSYFCAATLAQLLQRNYFSAATSAQLLQRSYFSAATSEQLFLWNVSTNVDKRINIRKMIYFATINDIFKLFNAKT